MAILTGIPPRELLALDGPMWSAMVDAVGEAWPMERELMASSLEVQHAAYCVALAAAGVKDLPEPLRVKRPGDPEKDTTKAPMSPLAFAAMYGGK